jgi:hypothetical protein
MDDAHLAEHCLHSLFSVEIDKFHHAALFTSLMTELRGRFPEYAVLSDALAGDVPTSSPAELLSFFDQTSVAARLREIIDTSPNLGSDPDLKFRWARVRNHLNEANIYVSVSSLWIRPYVYPTTVLRASVLASTFWGCSCSSSLARLTRGAMIAIPFSPFFTNR